MRVLEAEAVISAKDRTGQVFSNVAKKIRGIDTAAGTLNKRVGVIERTSKAIERGSGAIVASTGRMLGPIAAGYGVTRAIKRFADTEMAITRIGITADATDEQIAKLQQTLRELAHGAGKPFDEVTQGLEQLTAGGMDLPQALPAMPAIVRTAQAAGAEVRDMANTALALGQNLGIASNKMQDAFDILVAGGKAGKFELKDMARYLPSIMPAAVAVGMKGEAGLKRIVGLLQTVRMGTGSTEEAAASVQNIFAKMESEETAKRFKKFGVDLRGEMKKARAEGRDLLTVFTELTDRATGGDLSKIPQLFSDMEFARGMRALMSFRDLLTDVMGKLDRAKGAADQDFKRVTARSQVAITRLSESWDRATESVGRLVNALGGSGALNSFARSIEALISRIERLRGLTPTAPADSDDESPKTFAEVRDRYLAFKKRERATSLDDQILVAERDLAAAEATAAKRPGLGRDPGQARVKVERLRSEREMLRLQIAALDLPTVPSPVDLTGGSVVKALDPTSTSDGKPAWLMPKVHKGPLPQSDPRRQPATVDFVNGLDLPPNFAPHQAAVSGGKAEVTNRIEIVPSRDFIARVVQDVRNNIGWLRINKAGDIGSGGSTGTSMPEALPGGAP